MLLLSERYFAGNRYYGQSAFMDHWVPCLMSSGMRIRYMFLDTIESQGEFESLLQRESRHEDVIMILAVGSPLLSPAVLKRLKADGKKIIAFYSDSWHVWATPKRYKVYQKHYWYRSKIARQRRLAEYVDVFLQSDQPHNGHPDRTVFVPPFQATEIFFPSAVNGKTIDVSFVGTRDKSDRMSWINACPGIVVAGGAAGVERIGLDEYADIVRSSKLGLQVPHFDEGQDFLNARLTQILYSRSALMHPPGPNINRFFEPGIDFIPIKSPSDFAEKVGYYLAHEEEREEIAFNGWQKATERYSFAEIWKQVQAQLNASSSGG